MIEHARHQRFEEAGWLRDRHRGLARAIEHRRRWNALAGAGRVVIERSNGETAVIDQGRYVAGWNTGAQHPLLPPPEFADMPPVPPTVAVAAEADLIWKWLDHDDARIVDATHGLTYPAKPVDRLRAAG